MAFAFVGNNSAAATAASEIDLNMPAGVANGNAIVAVYAFEGVATGSGPWIIPNNGQLATDYIGPSTGWQQVCFQSPSATGVGIEVWFAIFNSGTHQFAKFATNQNAAAVCAAYSGEFNPSNSTVGGLPRLAVSAAVTGNQPAAPSVVANSGELVVAVGGDLMTAAQFGTPSGFTNRIDARRGAAGTVEATIADAVSASSGATGLIIFPNAAAAGSTPGSTATLAIRPAPTTTSSGPILEAPFPPDLDLPDGYTVEWTALDDVGADVPGVIVSGVSIFGTDLGGVQGSGDGAVGPFMLVPGPGA